MKTTGALLLSLLSSAVATPAVVWNKADDNVAVSLRTSKPLQASDFLADVLSVENEDSSFAAVVFLLGRSKDGSESLSELASSNALPEVSVKYDRASAIHHNVHDVRGASVMVKESQRANPEHSVHSVTLEEYSGLINARKQPVTVEVTENGGMMSKTQKSLHKRAAQLAEATVLIVDVDPLTNPADIDKAVVSAIDDESIATVVLTAVRSHDEVKLERRLANQNQQRKMEIAGRRMLQAKQSKRRRLEDQENDDGQEAGEEADIDAGIYYVSMTPNILAGIMFWFMFASVTYIGVSCMGMIAGQDVYVDKMPSIGREA